MIIKTGDTTPALVIDLASEGDEPDLANADSVRVIGRRALEVAFDDDDPTITGAATVTHEWAAGETDEPGRIWVEVKVSWSATNVQTFPTLGQLAVDVVEGLS